MTREEHLAWCKERALEFVDRGELANAVASMGLDLSKHAETQDAAPPERLTAGFFFAWHNDHELVRRWIEGF